MKLLLFTLALVPSICSAQLVFEVNSPAEESGVFPCMAGEDSEWSNSPDLYQNGNWFSDTLVLADDGVLGSACSSLNNSITSNFALFHRSGCSLGQSLLNAQNAGATGAIVIDSVDGRPLPFDSDGLSSSITIPFVIISRGKGDSLIQRITENENVLVSFGDKTGINNTDVGIYKEFSLWSRYGVFPFGYYFLPDDHFGTWVYNHGNTDVNNLQVKLWFYHNVSNPQHNQEVLSLPFDLITGDSTFINFDFEYDHISNGHSIYEASPLNYGYELIGIVDNDTLDNKISQLLYSEEKLISNSFSPSIYNTDFSEIDYFIEGSDLGYDSIGYCVYMPIKIKPQNLYPAHLCNPIVPMANGDPGAEESVMIQDIIIGNQQATFDNYYDGDYYYVGNLNDTVYSHYYLFNQQPITQNTDIVVSIQTSSSTELGFSSDMYHDEQIRQGYLPTYFRKAVFSTSSTYEAQYILTPIISFDMWYYPFCIYNSLEEIDNSGVSTFPNPATNELSITSTERMVTITIYDLFGKQVTSDVIGQELETTLNIEKLNPGCYLLEVTNEIGQKNVLRFIKN
ncbi:MAG: T9SS type A sorting domain-containing protein [Crocinitomicaceae bacterium]|nr:T9SS type A sorting domain-containing protein [Flavobacteriales bacterium]NQZ34833.1 T9SS type A sorting domain-containing protein [Crocinitomicaceae bacterium]